MADRIPLHYTFGNHQHWVDMEWLWGYHVLPNSIRDMLKLCQEAGVKGCVNFDGIGYEKLASEDPEAFADLKKAIQDGTFEIVGGSYGQPYGLFHGGESNVRQRIFGARASKRLFGVPVKTFWEEEFDFFPQLPQILRGVGIECASLFFQWTWHTPEVPREDVPVVWWEGQDGSRLLCATRNKLNLHQWPEDMDIVLAELAESPPSSDGPTPLVLQWLELMPSPDWMCRSELILPKLRQLMSDERFDVRPITLGEYLRGMNVPVMGGQMGLPVRRYTMDQVWHGMTLGKNGDNIRRLSRQAEASLLSAETLSAVAGLFGRPYAQWDVYPTWELEEAWRELLSAQHHDIDECEGLCGYVGRFSYDRSIDLSARIRRATLRRMVAALGGSGAWLRPEHDSPRRLGENEVDGLPSSSISHVPESMPDRVIFFNPLGWPVEERFPHSDGSRLPTQTFVVPAFGYTVIERGEPGPQIPAQFRPEPIPSTLEHGDIRIEKDMARGGIAQLTSREFPQGALDGGSFDCAVRHGGAIEAVAFERSEFDESSGKFKTIRGSQRDFRCHCAKLPGKRGIEIDYLGYIHRPDAGLNGSLQIVVRPSFRPRLIADQPYGVAEIHPTGKGLKKYPTGDWMTSPQWFEEVRRPFTALSFIDLVDADNPDRGLLIVHSGSQQWLLADDGTIRCVLSAYDPWDENYFLDLVGAQFWVFPHGPLRNSERWKMAQEVRRRPYMALFDGPEVAVGGFSGAACDADNVALTAFYRETRDSAKGQDFHAADLLGVDYPYVLRLVELDGIETEATLTFGATVARALKTNLLGEPEIDLDVSEGTKVQIRLRPFEIATVYLDLVEGRKQVRDLDAKREIWATVHRVD